MPTDQKRRAPTTPTKVSEVIATQDAIRGDIVATNAAMSKLRISSLMRLAAILVAIGVAAYLIDQRSAERYRAYSAELEQERAADMAQIGRRFDQAKTQAETQAKIVADKIDKIDTKVDAHLEAISGHLGKLSDRASASHKAATMALSKSAQSLSTADEIADELGAVKKHMLVLTRSTYSFVDGIADGSEDVR